MQVLVAARPRNAADVVCWFAHAVRDAPSHRAWVDARHRWVARSIVLQALARRTLQWHATDSHGTVSTPSAARRLEFRRRGYVVRIGDLQAARASVGRQRNRLAIPAPLHALGVTPARSAIPARSRGARRPAVASSRGHPGAATCRLPAAAAGLVATAAAGWRTAAAAAARLTATAGRSASCAAGASATAAHRARATRRFSPAGVAAPCVRTPGATRSARSSSAAASTGARVCRVAVVVAAAGRRYHCDGQAPSHDVPGPSHLHQPPTDEC